MNSLDLLIAVVDLEALEAAMMEEGVSVEAVVPIQVAVASILPVEEASPVEEEASCLEVEELHFVQALEEILLEAWEAHLLPWMEAEEVA